MDQEFRAGTPFRVSAAVIAAAAIVLGVSAVSARASSQSSSPPVTFAKDIAPIVFEKCAACHSPSGSAPFSLLTYDSAKPRASRIAEVTSKRIMPPWKAEPGYGGDFVGQHPLTDAEIATIQRWVQQGAPEGNPQDLPPAPKPSEGWRLGTPDLIVTPLEPYVLQAEGHDVWHIFVIRIPVNARRYVKGMEMRTGAPGVLHHANIRIDTTPNSRQLDEQYAGPGYKALLARSATYPHGHFLGWTRAGCSCCRKGSRGVSTRHGSRRRDAPDAERKPELVAPLDRFFFTDDPPSGSRRCSGSAARRSIFLPAKSTT